MSKAMATHHSTPVTPTPKAVRSRTMRKAGFYRLLLLNVVFWAAIAIYLLAMPDERAMLGGAVWVR
jgi:hypothetical protein